MLTTNWQRPDLRFLCITPGAHTMALILATAGLGQAATFIIFEGL